MFIKEVLTPEEARIIVENSRLIQRAMILDKSVSRPFSVQVQNLDLSTARLSTQPLKISTSFKSLYVEDATDVSASVNVRFDTVDSLQGAFAMKLNDSIVLNDVTNECYLHWDAQPGKTMRLIVFTDAAFQSGSQISVSGGGVSINTGSSFTRDVVTLVALTDAEILAQDISRKNASVYNATGADIWIGEAGVDNAGATRGIKWPADSIFEWKNTAALHAYSVAGGDIVTISEN